MSQAAFSAAATPATAAALPRLFVALELTSAISDKLESLVENTALSCARWAPRESWHITLHFLGASHLDKVRTALDTVRGTRFRAHLNGLGTFGPRGRPSILWAGVPDSPELLALKVRIGEALRDVGFSIEARKYVPHVTLAKFGRMSSEQADAVAEVVNQRKEFSTDRFLVDRFTLFESEWNDKKPVYIPRAHYLLE